MSYQLQDVEALKELTRQRCKSDLFFLAKRLLGYNDMSRETHANIVTNLTQGSSRKLIVCPRGSFKSSLCVVAYSIWRLINDPNLRILIDTELFGNSKTYLREIRNHLESEDLTTLFGEFRGEQWSEGAITIQQRTKNLKEASITCSGIGVEKTGQHFDVVLMDDLNSPKNSDNPEQRQKVIQHFRYMQSILEPGGTMVVVGTRYHADDVIGHILETQLDLPNDGSSF